MLVWKIFDVKGDGSCFFRSLYNAAIHTGNISTVIRRLKTPNIPYPEEWTEDTFVRFIRYSISDIITNPITGSMPRRHIQAKEGLQDMFTNLKTIRDESKSTYKAIIDAYPQWFQNHFAKLPKSFTLFSKRLAKQVVRKSSWVSEIEVRMILQILHNVPIIILNSPPKRKDQLDCKTMYLLNLGESHYNYILCRECNPKILNPQTKRCVKRDGSIAKKVRKIKLQSRGTDSTGSSS